MKKRMIAWALALVMVLALVPAANAAGTAITLKVWAPQEDIDWLNSRLADFEALYPQWDITWDVGVIPTGDAAYMISQDPEAGPDVFIYYSDQMYTLIDAGALLPLTVHETKTALANSTQTLMNTVKDSDGAYYGYPIASNTWFMYYNKNTFSEEDVKSLETMLEKGKVSFELTNSWHLPAFYFANGCTLFGADGNDEAAGARFGGDRGTAVTLRLVELLQYPNFIADDINLGYDRLKTGTIDAYFSGYWEYAGLYEALGEDLGAAQLPTVCIDGQDKQMLSYLGSHAIGVNGFTQHDEAARALAAFLSSENSQLLRWEASGSAVPAAPALAQEPSVASNVAAVAQINTSVNTSRVQPCVPAMGYCWGPLATFGNDLANGVINAENAAEYTEQLNLDMNGGVLPSPFIDVPADSFYYDPVMWAVEKGVTNGLTADTFGPTATCNRAQVVTFLWRAAGCPEPTSSSNPFVDVQAGSFYEKPVLWAVEHNITNGSDATHFNPNGVCNRAQVVTFLYRAFESPAVENADNPFTDVPAGSFYEAPVLWAVENGITNGLSATTFGPNTSCNRAQVVTFLYRAYND